MSRSYEIRFISVTTVTVTNAESEQQAQEFALEEIGFDVRRGLCETKTSELASEREVESSTRHSDHQVNAADYA